MTLPCVSSRIVASTAGARDDWGRAPLPPGRARVLQGGTDVTVLTWGRMVSETNQALEQIGDEVSVELIDVRTLVPLDAEAIREASAAPAAA